jgi:hypothetical protein
MRIINANGTSSVDVTWKMEYNGLNQLTKRYNGSTWDGGTDRYG